MLRRSANWPVPSRPNVRSARRESPRSRPRLPPHRSRRPGVFTGPVAIGCGFLAMRSWTKVKR
jgi:hypothetical protein